MTKTPNPPAQPVERTPAPADVPRVTYTTIEGTTTVINAPAAAGASTPTTAMDGGSAENAGAVFPPTEENK